MEWTSPILSFVDFSLVPQFSKFKWNIWMQNIEVGDLKIAQNYKTPLTVISPSTTCLLLGAGRRPSQGSASVFCFYFWCSEFPELCSVTKPKPGLSLGTKVKILLHHSHWFSLRSSGVGRYWSGKVGYWCFFGFFLFINSSPRLSLYRHIVAIKATIDKQSPNAKLLCLNISNEVEISSFWSWQKI